MNPAPDSDVVRVNETGPRPLKASGHFLFWSLALIGAFADLLAKYAVFSKLETSDTHTLVLIPGVLNFVAHTNTGGVFSILRGHPALFVAGAVVAFVVIGYLYVVLARSGQKLLLAAIGLISAGALGNFYDRVFFGHVRDFIQVWIGSWPYPTFNVADALICIGAGLIILSFVLQGRQCCSE